MNQFLVCTFPDTNTSLSYNSLTGEQDVYHYETTGVKTFVYPLSQKDMLEFDYMKRQHSDRLVCYLGKKVNSHLAVNMTLVDIEEA